MRGGTTLPASGVVNALWGVVVAGGVDPDKGVNDRVGGVDGLAGGADDGLLGGTDEGRTGSAGGIERSDAGPSRYSSLSW